LSRSTILAALALAAAELAACQGGSSAVDAGASADRAAVEPDGAAVDAAWIGADCAPGGAPGACLEVADCAALGDHTSVPGYCPGPAGIQCCIRTPNPADNPPLPAGYRLMAQADVTPEMTAWAVDILHDPVTYPMFATATRTFGTLTVLARVEWHPPDFQNGVVHRGVTLYQPI
jgi:hypothetical protein